LQGRARNGFSKIALTGALAALVVVAGVAAYVSLRPSGQSSASAAALSIKVIPPSPLVSPGQVQNYSEIEVESLESGLSGTLTVGVSAPAGLSVVLNQTAVPLSESPQSIPVELKADTSLAPGNYRVTVEASSSAIPAENQTFTVDVVPALIIMQWPTFHPQNMTVAKGTPVTWLNIDSTIECCDPGYHDVSFSSGANATSPILMRFDNWTYTFESDGVVDYFCTIHPIMKGQVTVTG
jgi:plastocyanin